MPRKDRTKASMIAGTFLLVGVVGFIIISALISGVLDRFEGTDAYTVRFNLKQSTGGLKPGSAVLLGGQPVGRVSDVAFAEEEGRAVGVDIRVRVEEGLTLYKDAVFVLERPLIGLGAGLNITSSGTPAAGALEPGGVVHAELAIPPILAAAGYGAEQIEQFQAIVKDSRDVIARINDLTHEIEEDLISGTKNFNRFSESLSRVDSEGLALSTGDAVDEFRALVEESRELLRVNRPRIDDLMTSAQNTMTTFETEGATRLIEAIEHAGVAAERLAEVADTSADILVTETPAIRRTLANARLASDQLRLAMIEIRRNPWKLLGAPDTKELKEEIFYDAARAYATVASDLQDASASLETALAKREDLDQAQLETLSSELKDALVRYKEAEVKLLEVMFE